MTNDPKKHIILVEDDGFLGGMYVSKLELENFDVTLVDNGEDAIARIRDRKPDLVLLDILLPRKNGFEVLSDMKKDPATRNIPVFMLTNLGQPADIDRARALGADEYIVKVQHMPAEVIRKIKHYFDQRSA